MTHVRPEGHYVPETDGASRAPRVPWHIRDRGQTLRAALAECGENSAARVVTNIVIAELAPGIEPVEICAALREQGVLVNPLEDGRLRFVTHCDVNEADINRAIGALHTVFHH